MDSTTWTSLLVHTEDVTNVYIVGQALEERNPFDPRTPGRVLPLLFDAADGRWGDEQAHAVQPPRGVPVSLWRDHLSALVDALEADRQRVLDSDGMCIRPGVDRSGDLHSVLVTHCQSGLRARAYLDSDGFLVVHSKPYIEDSACTHAPLYDRDWPDWWRRYLGIGIGQRIYTTMMAQFPHGTRAQQLITSPEAKWVRRSLHRRDPYVWQYEDCSACGPIWRESDRAAIRAAHATTS
ncbi:hypothetical protein FK530_23405 [Tsukamurella conjunctivitidis]|uniref:Uncharacterized protein n=1 Tax=Tsukamurella conjunctivitidis TaxID=2592068 RepID=A0A5C5RR10_9ACTN|nr:MULTISPECIES: hypothetical protein [Tsukamurella]TWS24631.1 hypothetical protein FK530_23405 [Tsukamurella conjunctivitidis]